jgi:hypothetical protein
MAYDINTAGVIIGVIYTIITIWVVKKILNEDKNQNQ